MYCSGCGNEIARGLNYCNGCGARTTDDNLDLRKTIAKNFSIGIGIIGTFGLIGFVILIKEFLASGVGQTQMFVIAFLYLSAFVSICYFMMSNILKTVSNSSPVDPVEKAAPQLKMPDTNKLNEFQEPAQSVVENTTRMLDEVLVERK